VAEGDVEGGATVLGVNTEGHGLANLELSAEKVDLVLGVDLVVVGRIGEGEGKHTLLLQVGLVDTSEGAGDDGETTEVTGLESGVLAGRALTVVPVTDDNPLDATGFVVTGSGGDGIVLLGEVVLDLVGLTVLSVGSTDQHVVGDVVQVATVLQPRASHGDVVSGGLALALDQDGDVSGILAIPGLEASKNLETVGGGGDSDRDSGTVGGRSLVGVTAGIVATAGKTVTGGSLELELLAVLVLEGVGQGVEVEGTGNSHGDDEVRGGNEGVGSGVGIVTTGEVTVVRRDDGVGLTLLDILTIPLSNARTAGVGKDDTAVLLEGLELTVTLDGGANLLGTRGDGEQRLGLQTVVKSVTGDGSSAGHILVGGVGARADQTDLELLGPLVGLDSLLELRDRSGKIGGEGTVDVGLELIEVDLDELIVLSTLILTELGGVLTRELTNVLTLGGLQVVVHAVVEGEDGGSGTNLSTHVTDGSHTSAGEGLNTGSVVLNDGTSTTLDGEETSDLQDDILGGGPAGHLTGEADTDNVGGLQLPGETGHDVDGISTTDTNGGGSETTGVGGVGIGTDDQTTGEGVVLENDLVNDTRTGLPETDVVLGGSGGKEVVDLLVDVVGTGKILLTANLGLNQVVTVDSGRGLDAVHASGHELQDSHLGGGILASNTIGTQLEVRDTTLDVLAVRVVKVRVQDLLGESERALQTRTDNVEVLGHLLVVDVVTLRYHMLVTIAWQRHIPAPFLRRHFGNHSQSRGWSSRPSCREGH
jgi:hypothetical protein